MDFRRESVAEMAAAVRSGELSARELVVAAIDRIEALDGDVNAFVAVDFESALTDADAVDGRIAK
ncbi:hypothetical protein BH24ACT3_BH24ACT3_13120 [soil metagenome]